MGNAAAILFIMSIVFSLAAIGGLVYTIRSSFPATVRVAFPSNKCVEVELGNGAQGSCRNLPTTYVVEYVAER